MKKLIVLMTLLSFLQIGIVRVAEAGTTRPETDKIICIDIARTVKSLNKIHTDSFGTTVPIKARPLLTTLKHRLRDLISTVLDSQACQSENSDDAQEILLRKLQEHGIILKEPQMVPVDENYNDKGYTYGGIWEIKLEKLTDHPDLLAATTTIDICCGEDTSFYLFRKNECHWDLIIAREANDYNEVSGAQGTFHYAVSPLSAPGQFFVVTAHIPPWCSSNWQVILYRVFREGADPYRPKILFEREEGIFLGNDTRGAITVQRDAFRIEFEAAQWLYPGSIRTHIAAYRVEGNQVWRIPPMAAEPEGFLDEWFDMPWEEAVKWIDSPDLTSLGEWHQRLGTSRLSHDSQFLTSFAFSPPACEVREGLWEVGIEFDPLAEGETLPAGMPGEIYFHVALKDGAFILKSVSSIPGAPRCSRSNTSEE